MNLKLFEVAGTHIFSMSAIVMVLFFVFAIIVVGYLLGKINIKGGSLGTAAIFLVALVVGTVISAVLLGLLKKKVA